MNEIEISNFIEKLNKINSFAGRIRYANENLERIGSGSGRIVYILNDTKVLKLAKNQKGIAQNCVEYDVGNDYVFIRIVAEVFDTASDSSWIIAERGKKVTQKRIVELTGIPDLQNFTKHLVNTERKNKNRSKLFSIDQSIEDKLLNNDFAGDVYELMYNYGVSAGDNNRPSTYGEVIRDGKPAIVLTDYGLNDEVYNTYYNPNRNEKIRMYELYNFNDGNDDILSDVNGGNDIRCANWALIPQGIGDGDDTINEEFISFVERRNKYPNKSISNIGALSDEFHNCINNLNEILNIVKNKKIFCENLLKLQEYLVSQNCYNWDRIELYEYDFNAANKDNIPSVKPYSLKNKEYAERIVNDIGEKLGFKVVNYLGDGSYGFAFRINSGNVFKITTDVGEIDAASILIRKNPIYIAEVYNIYKIVDTEKNMSFYGIIEEYVPDKPQEQFFAYNRVVDKIKPNGMNTVDFLIKMKKGDFNYDELLQLSNGILNQNKEAEISVETRKAAYNYLMGLLKIKKELVEYGIRSNDYGNPKNIGYDDKGVLKYFDFGSYRAEEPNLDNAIVMLPENENLMKEVYDKNIADDIVNQMTNKFKFNNVEYIDSGEFGAAYSVNDNMVLKITKDNSEAVENSLLIGKKLERIAEPYKVYTITSKVRNIPKTYAILLEKLRTTPEIERMYKRLDFIFQKLFNVNLSEVVEEYLGFSSGWIKKNNVDNYFSKNPEDFKFFKEIMEIAKECNDLGISSLDFYNWRNLGYKKDGKLGFFDVGFGDGFFVPHGLENIEIVEVFGGSSLHSTTNSVGSDNNPTYNQMDSSDPIDVNIPRNTSELDERILSAMKGSSSVKVKKKCKLGGLGNTSAACNQGDINNFIIKPLNELIIPEFKFFSKGVSENIDATEAYNDIDSVKTILSGKRNIGLITLNNSDLMQLVVDGGLNIIPVKQKYNVGTSIIYRNGCEKQANKLHDIMKSNGGYLNDKTPEEAYEIGRLLGYTNDSISIYVNRKYPQTRKYHPYTFDEYMAMDENILTNDKILVPKHDHVGWISPKGEFIEGNHLQVILNIYRINYKSRYEYEETKKIYNMALNDGYTRVIYSVGGYLGDVLDIQTLTKERLKEIILGGYIDTIKKPESEIYCDVGDSKNNDYYIFKMNENREDLYEFLF